MTDPFIAPLEPVSTPVPFGSLKSRAAACSLIREFGKDDLKGILEELGRTVDPDLWNDVITEFARPKVTIKCECDNYDNSHTRLSDPDADCFWQFGGVLFEYKTHLVTIRSSILARRPDVAPLCIDLGGDYTFNPTEFGLTKSPHPHSHVHLLASTMTDPVVLTWMS